MKIVTIFLFLSPIPSTPVYLPGGVISTMAKISLLISREHSTRCLQIFHGEGLADHDRENIFDLWRALAVPESHTTTGIYSFNRYIARKLKKPWKVSCYKPLKILLGNNSTSIGYTYLTQTLRVKDSVWLLFLQSDVDEFLSEANMLFDCEFIVAKMQSEDYVSLYEVYRVRKDYPLRSQYYGNWTREGGLDVDKGSLYTRRSNLEGLVLRAGSLENWPTTWFNGKIWRGFLPKIWSVIQSRTNSSSIYYASVDGLTGLKNPNGSWNGLVGMLVREEIDVIVSEISVEKTRSHVVDFFHPLIYTSYQVYYRQLGYSLQWDSIFKPFGRSIWFALLFWLLLGSVVISLVYYISDRFGLESDQELFYVPARSFLFILQTLSQQGYHCAPQSAPCRMLFFLSYLVSAIIIPSYSASLISYLTQQVPYRPFNTLEEMHKDGRYRLLVKENTAEYGYFKHAKNQLLKDIFKQQILSVPPEHRMENSTHAFKTICHYPNYAFFGIEIIMSFRLGNTLIPDCPILRTTNPISSVFLTMGTIKNSPYSGLINHHVMKMISTGVAKRIMLKEMPRMYQSLPGSLRDVALGEVFQIFVFVGVSAIFSIALLVFEQRLYKHRKRMEKPRKSDVEKYLGYRPRKQLTSSQTNPLPIFIRRDDCFLH